MDIIDSVYLTTEELNIVVKDELWSEAVKGENWLEILIPDLYWTAVRKWAQLLKVLCHLKIEVLKVVPGT